jgi:hypothetical protein
MRYVAPRRAVSTAVTIAVTNSVLQQKAQSAGSGWTEFYGHAATLSADRAAATQVGGWKYPTPSDGTQPPEDNAGAAHTAIDWGAKGCYDPTTKKVMWASTGAGFNGPGGYLKNTQPIYHETGLNAGKWTVSRGFQSPNESNTNGIVHLYDSLCIDVAGRRFYKQKFSENLILAYDLDTGAWIDGVASAPQASSLRTGALDIVNRGAVGSMWCFGSNGTQMVLWQMDLTTPGTWTTLATGGNLGSATGSSLPMSFNPRALGGDGAVLCGRADTAACIINTTGTPAATLTGTPPSSFNTTYDSHLCKDPSGSGWLYFANNGRHYRCSDAGVWTDLGVMPAPLNTSNHRKPFIVVPIDDYGVVWVLGSTPYYFGNDISAWLYKP